MQLPITKTCFKCSHELHLVEFYEHSGMADGHLNKCKTCAKRDAREIRRARLSYYRAYDRTRGSRQSADDQRQYRKRNPEKIKAHNAVTHAIRAGKLMRMPCEKCGQVDGVHAHHDDYLCPLEVRWLCPEHHHQAHAKY